MTKSLFILFLFITVLSGLYSAEWSGIMDHTINYTRDDNYNDNFGLEHFTNLRFRTRFRENITFHTAFNLIATSGNFFDKYDKNLGFDFGNNAPHPYMQYNFYDLGLTVELERLYIMLLSEHIDSEIGLFRLNFGYGRVWGSSDFLNPRNPLALNARPRCVLGMNFSFYPTDDTRMMAFIAAPSVGLDSIFDDYLAGYQPGFVIDHHWKNISIQTLYVYETAHKIRDYYLWDMFEETEQPGQHNIGLSLKYDLGLSFVIDGLYRINPAIDNDIECLSIGTGFDYSMLSGNLYLLCEYLYSGSKSITSIIHNGIWRNNNYLHSSVLYRFNDFLSLNLSAIYSIDDGSFMPISKINYELSQRFSVSINTNIPLDNTVFNGNQRGELGPYNMGRFILNIGTKYRF